CYLHRCRIYLHREHCPLLLVLGNSGRKLLEIARLEDFAEPAAHAVPEGALVGVAALEVGYAHVLDAELDEADAGGVAGAAHDVDEAADAHGGAAADGHAEDVFGQLGHALEDRRAAGDDA